MKTRLKNDQNAVSAESGIGARAAKILYKVTGPCRKIPRSGMYIKLHLRKICMTTCWQEQLQADEHRLASTCMGISFNVSLDPIS
jgi:hypothetical protein